MIKNIVLENGLQLILNQDKTKYQTTAEIYIKASGLNNEYYIDGIKSCIPNGVAHFLEHYLIEYSIYGNIADIFSKDCILSNGFTSNYKTNFYITTVHDFEDNFIKLLNVVNNPVFNKENLEKVKQPILSEINRKNDNRIVPYRKHVMSCLFQNDIFDKILGSIDDVNKITIDDLKDFYLSFYQPQNQIIVLTGNFDDNIIDLIKNNYDNFKNNYYNVQENKLIESEKVVTKESVFKGVFREKFFSITYKIKIYKFSPLEKNKIDYYISYILNTNFGENSSLFNYLIENKLSLYSIDTNYDPSYMKDFLIVSIEVTTDKFDEVIPLIKNKINNLDINEDSFTEWQNQGIIRNINNTEKINFKSNNYVDNVLLYNLYQYDDIDFIKSLNIYECQSLIHNLDFSNYSVVVNDGI